MVKVPEDLRQRFIIDSVAMYVMVDGCAFEQALMTRETQNPEFMFLFDLASPEHAYYRWRVYSLAQVRLLQYPMQCVAADSGFENIEGLVVNTMGSKP